MTWRDQAACLGTFDPAFFPVKGGNQSTARRVKQICWMECPVRVECLDYALATNAPFGIFGGMTEKERRVYRRRAA